MKFLKASTVKDDDGNDIVAVQYLDNHHNRCTSFYKPGVPSAAAPLIELINQTVQQEKRDIDDGK